MCNRLSFLLLTATTCLANLVSAEVVRFEISERIPFADGVSFGEVGPYERIVGNVVYSLDRKHPSNRQVVDLNLASHQGGHVQFHGDLVILAPKDLSKGSGALLYDVNNRGNKLALRFFNDASSGNEAVDAGQGFLMRQGITVVWSGWDGELLPGSGRMRMHPPVIRSAESPVTGPVRYELTTDKEASQLKVSRSGHGGYWPLDRELPNATLTWRLRPGDRRVPIPRSQFKIHATEVQPVSTGQLPQIEVELSGGFRPGYLYELIYMARDPIVHGVSFAGLRDLISSFKYGGGDNNPLLLDGKPGIQRAHGFGVSQSGRFLREFAHTGFNADKQGRQVFDGLIPHVAGGGLGSFNHRFAQPTAFVTQYELHDWNTDRFPFAYQTQVDPLSGEEDGILRRSVASKTAPKVFHTQTSVEYWSRSGSLVHTDPIGKQDGRLPKNVRVYALGGCQHGVTSFPPQPGKGQLPANPADYRPQLRALLVVLDRWCREGTPPPPSVHPSIAKGTLVRFGQASTGFPALPGIRYPSVIQQPSRLDFGSRWSKQRIITQQPPRATGHYQVLVARCDVDGNELDSLSPVEVQAPLATFTGWNLRAADPGPINELVGLNGSYIPLPVTRKQREATGDPRRSLEERYGDLESYVEQVRQRCEAMIQGEYLLEEDVQGIVDRQQERAKPLFDQIKESSK